MCRLLAMINADRRAAEVLLRTGVDSFASQARTNHDGVGLALLTKDGIGLAKTHRGANDSDVLERGIRSIAPGERATMIGHVRMATQGEVRVDNAHPYFSADGSLAIAHNGNVPKAPIERELGADVVAGIPGSNDSRLWTRFIGDRIAEAGYRDGITDAVRWLHANSDPARTSGNFVGVGADGTVFASRTHVGNTLGVSAIGDADAGARGLLHVVSSQPIGRTEQFGASIVRRELEAGEAVLIRPGAAPEFWHTGVPST